MAALSLGEARRIAGKIRGSRLAVAAAFDEIVARAGGGLDDFKTVALGVDDPVEAYAQAILSAANATAPWHRALLGELAAQGLIDLAAALAESPAGGDPLMVVPQNADGTVIDPQAFTAAMSGTLGVAELLGAFNLAARRLCLIKADGKQGTGFLIGPHTVLTNWHVMADLIDLGTGKARPDSASKIDCKFETLTDREGRGYPAAEDWLVGFSPLAAARIDPAAPVPAAASPDGTFLDYCAIRLLRAPGRERGWYDLANTGALENATDAFFVFQHPSAVPQRAGFATDTKQDQQDPNFLNHQVWTASGSSGGLCLDHKLRPIGLHHAAVWHETEVDAAGKRKLLYNRAVKLSAIHAARPDLGETDPIYDRISRLADGSQAVIGRAATQATLRLMAVGKAPPILIIRGNRLSGKSFSTVLLQHSTPSDARRIIPLSATELPADAVGLARLILDRAGAAPEMIDGLPKPDAPLTTDAAWVRSTLFPALRQALHGLAHANAAQPLVLWLVIDEIDVVPMPGIGARTLLDLIYADAELLKDLRVILIGLAGTLTSIDPRTAATELLVDPRRVPPQEVEECLSSLMTEARIATAAREAGRHTDLVLGATDMLDAQGGQSSPLVLLSRLVSEVYMKAVDRWQN